ncbi:MAG: hypothetical protein JNM66_04800 [Bryobacterales bacterium]|nr:hypothetical protein [Bryobacterales bacterium]
MPSVSSGPKIFAVAAAVVLAAGFWFAGVRTPRPISASVIRVVALSSSGRWIAAGTSQGAVYACGLAELNNCRAFEVEGRLNDLRFSESDEMVIADRNLRVANPAVGQARRVRGDGANYGAVRISPGRRSILTIDGKGAIETIDLDTGRSSPAYCCSSIWGEVEFIDRGRRAVWAGHWPGMWDFAAGKLVGRFTAQREVMTFGPIEVDAEGRLAYMGSQDGHVYQWNTEGRELLAKSPPLPGYVRTVKMLGGTGWIAYASQPGAVHLWNPKNGEHRVVRAARTASNIQFDRQRGLAVFGAESGALEFWDLHNERLMESSPSFTTGAGQR